MDPSSSSPSSSMSSMSSGNKLLVGALSAAATVVLGYVAYTTLGSSSSSSSSNSSNRAKTRGQLIKEQGRKTAGSRSALMDLELEKKLLSRAFHAMHAKDLIACLTTLNEAVERFPRSFDSRLLRARAANLVRDFLREETSADGVAAKVRELASLLDREEDLRVAGEVTANDAQRVIVGVEAKLGHLEEKDLELALLEQCLEEINRAMGVSDAETPQEGTEGDWSESDKLLLERINLGIGCITKLSAQMDTQADDQEAAEQLQERLIKHITTALQDCDKVIQASKTDDFVADAYFYRATLMNMGSPDQLACISKCIEKIPDYADALMLRAQIYASAYPQVPELAQKDVDKVIKLDPSNTDVLFLKAVSLIGAAARKPRPTGAEAAAASPGQEQDQSAAPVATESEEAKALLEKILELKPGNFEVAFTLCSQLQRDGDVHKAPDVIRKQIESLGPETTLDTRFERHLLLAEFLLSAQQFDECIRICEEQDALVDQKKENEPSLQAATDDVITKIDLVQKHFRSLQDFATSVRDGMPKFPTVDKKFAGERAPFVERLGVEGLRQLVLTEEEAKEDDLFFQYIDCIVYLFVAGTERISMYQALDRFKELAAKEGSEGIRAACRGAFYLLRFFLDYVSRGEEGHCFIVDSNFVNTLNQLLQAEKDGQGEFFESVDQFMNQIMAILQQRSQQQRLQQQQLMMQMQQQQQQQQQQVQQQ